MPDSKSATQDQATQQRSTAIDRDVQRQQPGASGAVQRYGQDPYSSQLRTFRRLSDEMDRLFERAFGDFGLSRRPRGLGGWSGAEASLWSPRIEAFQKDNQFIVRAELPGLKKEDVRVNVTDDAIVIEGERKHEFEQDRDGMFHSERSYGSFYREIPLPDGAIGDKAEATFKDGVLEVKLDAPPREVTRGRTIDIK